MFHLLDVEIQMPGEIDSAGKNFLIDAEGVVVEKWGEPVGSMRIYF